MNKSEAISNAASCKPATESGTNLNKFIKKIKNNSAEAMLTVSIAVVISGTALVAINPLLSISLIAVGSLTSIGLAFYMSIRQHSSLKHEKTIQTYNKQEHTERENINIPDLVNKDILHLLTNKSSNLLAAENNAINKLKQNLNEKNIIQNELKNLSTEQLKIFFPYLYPSFRS